MVTTFFPPHNFGGDGIHVYRLSNELARRGHEVTVVYPRDAYRLFTRVEPDDVYPLEPGVTIVPVTSTAGRLGPVSSYLTGRPALMGRALTDAIGQRARRRALPQRLARRRRRRPPRGRRRQALHDERALARLPDARALEDEPRAVPGAPVHPVPARLPPAAAALALRPAARPRGERDRPVPLAEPVHDRRAPGARLSAPDAAPAVLPARVRGPRARGGGGARASVRPLRRASRGAQGPRPCARGVPDVRRGRPRGRRRGGRAEAARAERRRPPARALPRPEAPVRASGALRRGAGAGRPVASATRCSASSCSRRSRRGRPRSSATSAPCRS